MRTCVTSILLATLAFTAATAPAATATIAPFSLMPPALTPVLQGGLKVIKSFPAASGLTGWVLQSQEDGEYNVFFTTADGQSVMAGALVSSAGVNLTKQYVDQYVPGPDWSLTWRKLESSAVVVSGTLRNPKSVIYVLMDPNCSYCHLLWKALRPYEAAGLQVRWVPVGILREDSIGKAAALLQGGDTALAQSQMSFDVRAESAAIDPIPLTPELKAKIAANTTLMQESKVSGTPGIFFKDASGAVQRHNGMLYTKDLPALLGMPEQAQTDPELARFKGN